MSVLRKGFLLGLGATISGKERVEKVVNDFVDRNELTQEQAKSLMDDLVEKGENKTDEWDQKQQEQARKIADELGLALKEDVDELKQRVETLEQANDQSEETT